MIPPRKQSSITRRKALKGLGWGFVGLAIAALPIRKWWRLDCMEMEPPPGTGWGPLKPDPNGLLDLPDGFSYRILCREGERMDDGYLVPGSPDGTGVFAMPDGEYRLIRNHELSANQSYRSAFGPENRPDQEVMYDPACLGGAITLVLDRNLKLQRKFLTLAGTDRNCSGCTTPWGSWLSSEESVTVPRSGGGVYTRRHGYMFQVGSDWDGLRASPPLTAMGRFKHEGAAIHPATGEVYLTEDRMGGCFYRFIPDTPGDLSTGRLYALRIKGNPGVFTGNRPLGDPKVETPEILVGQSQPVDWVLLEQPDPPGGDTLHLIARGLGAAGFSRGEGADWDGEGIVFIATNGGPEKLGQIWKYLPGGEGDGSLLLAGQSEEKCSYYKPDNIALQPNGDLMITEDNNKYTRLIGITPDGTPYPFAYFRYGTREELTGIAFSPDHRFLTVSVYELGLTLLITGPFGEKM